MFYSVTSALQAKMTPGNLGVSLLFDVKNTFWTKTAWIDEISMRTFMMASFHRDVIPKLYHWANEASAVRWEEEEFMTLPTWDEGYQKMMKYGYPGKLKHPSSTHTAYEIPAPKILLEIFN
ncbi:MAG: hypothetical protein EAZ76_16965 [Nostocales cyanobacterium]|nr:MAG: hypothetical protein EAZ87_02860 [Nostocales cyanobacterium]TAF08327.1 MAG: hypothetical protein EAZ76_16965 [Nostocales cyanobacterium]